MLHLPFICSHVADTMGPTASCWKLYHLKRTYDNAQQNCQKPGVTGVWHGLLSEITCPANPLA